MLRSLKQRSGELRVWTYAVYLACRDRRVPWYARVFGLCVVAYALSPIDLIPDFVPVLGYLDDLVLVPLGIALTIRMIPAPILAESRERIQMMVGQGKPRSWLGAIVVIAVWLAAAGLVAAAVVGTPRVG